MSAQDQVPQGSTEEAAVEAARAALATGAWSEAYEALLEADNDRRLSSSAAITMLAQAAYLSGDIEAAAKAFERMHTAALSAGDKDAAARAAGEIAFILFDAVMYAPSRAWLRRAERLIEDRPESPVRARTLNLGAWHALVRGDNDTALILAREASKLAEETGDRDEAAIARVAEGGARIAAGDMDGGLAVLDECSVAAVSGELSPPA